MCDIQSHIFRNSSKDDIPQVSFNFWSDCPLHRVQVDSDGAEDQGVKSSSEDIPREGVCPVQEEHPPQEADAGVHQRDQAELRPHQLGDGRVRQPGVGGQ